MVVWVKKSHVGKVATWQKTCNADDLERSRDMGGLRQWVRRHCCGHVFDLFACIVMSAMDDESIVRDDSGRFAGARVF